MTLPLVELLPCAHQDMELFVVASIVMHANSTIASNDHYRLHHHPWGILPHWILIVMHPSWLIGVMQPIATPDVQDWEVQMDVTNLLPIVHVPVQSLGA